MIGVVAAAIFILLVLVLQQPVPEQLLRPLPPPRRIARPPDASASAVLSLTAYSPLSLYVPARRPALSAALGGDRAAAQAATTDGTAAGVCGANVRVRVRGPTPEAGCPSSLLASACGRLMCILRAREYSCTIACYVYVRVVGG